MNFKYVFDSPFEYKNRTAFDFFAQGCSPQILSTIIQILEDNKEYISKVQFALYLYNNKVLADKLIQLANEGLEINIISIPLDGYDNRKPQNIIDVNNGQIVYKNVTKYDLAKDIYKTAETIENLKYKLYLFPHMYLRSERVIPFSRGAMPYSMHTKSFYFEYKNGGGIVGLMSSNIAVRDLSKFESLICFEGDAGEVYETKEFFNNLTKWSVFIKEFDKTKDWSNYNIVPEKITQVSNVFYTAPFIVDSNSKAEEILSNILLSAKKRIYICAQHISAYKYSYDSKYKNGNGSGAISCPGLLSKLFEIDSHNVDVKILSQTYVDENGQSSINNISCRAPANKFNFSQFVRDFKRNKTGDIRVNEGVHEKFIIVDDAVIISTFNYTPTQFIYLGYVNISSFVKMPDAKYSGIHSEVGQFIKINEANVVEAYLDRFNSIWVRKKTLVAFEK